MSGCNWEAIHGFNTPGEYRRFYLWLKSQLDADMIEEVPVGCSTKEMPFGVDEKWFRCKESSEVWRLVAPEAPFSGLWEEVE